jgi:hypothetical protein
MAVIEVLVTAGGLLLLRELFQLLFYLLALLLQHRYLLVTVYQVVDLCRIAAVVVEVSRKVGCIFVLFLRQGNKRLYLGLRL